MATLRTLVLMMILNSLMSACASSVRTGRIPEKGLTVSQLYHQAMDETGAQSIRHVRKRLKTTSQKAHKTYYEGAFQKAYMNVSHGFKTLENPAIPIFITSKVVLMGDEQLIKPGFVTAFYLYKQNQFALNTERF